MAKVMKIMKKILFIAAAMVAALTSCVKEADVDVPQEEAKVWVEFTAGVQTKAVLDGTSVTWEATDVVSINGVEFTTTEEDITEEGAAAKFRAEVGESFLEAESFTAVYPADAASWAESSLTGVVVPAEQNGTAKVVAVATVEDVTQTLNFMHVASFFKFQVPAAATEVTISADEALVGTVNDVAITTVDEVTTLAYDVMTGENTITVTSGFVPETDYYVAVLYGTKTNLTVSIDGKVSKTWATPVNVKQGMIANMKVLPVPEKDDRVVSFAEENVEVTYGTTGLKVQTLTGVEETEVVTYEVEGDAAEVDEDGNITLLKAGTVTITATVAETETFKAASASYTLTVYDLVSVYLKPNSNWTQANARFAAHLWYDDKSELWVDMTDEDKDGIYEAKFSGQYTNVIFCRMNPSNTENRWNNEGEGDDKPLWNQTVDLKVPTDGKNYFVIKKGAWDKGEDDQWMTEQEAKNYTEPVAIWGLAGTFNGWNASDETYLMTLGNDDWYEIAGVKLYTTDEFKFVSEKSWDISLGGSSNIQAVSGTTYDLNGGNNIKVKSEGVYTIRLNPTSKKFTATRTGDIPTNAEGDWRLVGSFQGWTPTDNTYKMSTEGVWFVYKNFTLSTSAQVKLVENASWSVNRGGTWVAKDKAITVSQDGANINVPAGTYDVYMDGKKTKVYFMTPGSVPEN